MEKAEQAIYKDIQLAIRSLREAASKLDASGISEEVIILCDSAGGHAKMVRYYGEFILKKRAERTPKGSASTMSGSRGRGGKTSQGPSTPGGKEIK